MTLSYADIYFTKCIFNYICLLIELKFSMCSIYSDILASNFGLGTDLTEEHLVSQISSKVLLLASLPSFDIYFTRCVLNAVRLLTEILHEKLVHVVSLYTRTATNFK